ncbi:helix-turn-helix domain-containing protein [Helicobacter ganmani]|uniref:helix-turn-helix domain-containing protein n=1 Tax=Helicobacter ganmani TaxID=60246 RepID=UPI003A8886B8
MVKLTYASCNSPTNNNKDSGTNNNSKDRISCFFCSCCTSTQTTKENKLNKGKNVAKIRKEKGISQLELSLRLGHKSVSIVASAERFYRGAHFNIEHLLMIAEILEVEICEFFKPSL